MRYMYENMNTQNTASFEQRIKQSTGNHKPNRHRKSHSKEPKILAAMKLKMAARKAQNKHKKVVSQARNRHGASYDESEDNFDFMNEYDRYYGEIKWFIEYLSLNN